MREVILNGHNMRDKTSAHAEIAAKLRFPEYYGNNLDALWDMLTTMDEAEVRLTASTAMLTALGSYGCKLLETFFDAAKENPRLRFSLEQPEEFDTTALEEQDIPEEP